MVTSPTTVKAAVSGRNQRRCAAASRSGVTPSITAGEARDAPTLP